MHIQYLSAHDMHLAQIAHRAYIGGMEKMKPKNIPMPASLLAAVDRWRGAQPGVPNASAAIRQLIAKALEADGIKVEVPKDE